MLRVNASIFFIAVCSSGLAQGTIDLIPSFKKGEEKKYSVRYTTKSPAQAPYQIFNSIKKDVIVKVTDARNDSIYFEWTYVNVIFTDSVPQFNPIMNLMNTLAQNLTVAYTTDNRGVIKSVTNHKEIAATVKQRIDATIETMSKDKGISSSLIENTRFQFQMMLSTKQQINEMVINDIFKFHELYGNTLSTQSKMLISATDPTTDKYETQLTSTKNSICQFEGLLTGDKRKGSKVYEFQTPSHWLKKYIYKLDSRDGMPVYQYYEIKLTNN
jgi:hypothetical protein